MLRIPYKATISYILFVILVNALFVCLPGVAAFGESFSPADLMVGGIYIMRDFAQREIQHKVIIAMIIATGLSYLLADKTIALASASAFIVAEMVDWLIYTFTRKPLSQRLILSSAVSAPFDSFIFLLVAHRLLQLPFLMMTIAKWCGVLLLWGLWKLRHHNHLCSNASKNLI